MISRTDFAPLLLRISLTLVFLYFGFSQLSSPDNWTGFVPDFVTSSALTANNFVVFNGILELVLGLFLGLGLYTRFAALVLAVHLVGITVSLGFSPVGMRDFGLMCATFVVFLNGPDRYTLDHFFAKKAAHHAAHQPSSETK